MTSTEPIAAQPARFGPEPPKRMRTWALGALVIWIVVLGAGVGWAILRGERTAREQTTMADAIPVLLRAQAELARAASADGLAVAALETIETSDCEVTMARDGVRWRAPVLAFVPAGTEEALLRRIADRLPASYGASVRTGSLPRLTGDAGTWVAISGTVIAPGQLRLLADTGDCRPAGDADLADPLRVGDQVTVQAVLDRLGVTAKTWRTHVAGCETGGTVETVEAVTAEGVDAGPLDDELGDLARPGRVAMTPELVAYTAGQAGVAVRVAGGRIVATSTTVSCR